MTFIELNSVNSTANTANTAVEYGEWGVSQLSSRAVTFIERELACRAVRRKIRLSVLVISKNIY